MIESIDAFLLHQRPYQGHGRLLDFLTKEYGLIRCISRHIRQAKINIQPFLQLQIHIKGKQPLKTLLSFEINDKPRRLLGEQLLIMLYINELLLRLLKPSQAQVDIFHHYHEYLTQLQKPLLKKQCYWLLRLFEKRLLDALGLGLNYRLDTLGGSIKPDYQYCYQAYKGFALAENGDISGQLLCALAQGIDRQTLSTQQLKAARLLLQIQFKPLLGNKPLQSRQLLKNFSHTSITKKFKQKVN